MPEGGGAALSRYYESVNSWQKSGCRLNRWQTSGLHRSLTLLQKWTEAVRSQAETYPVYRMGKDPYQLVWKMNTLQPAITQEMMFPVRLLYLL